MIVRLLAVTALLSLWIAAPARADEVPALAPSSPWTLDYDTDSCALRRWFGTGDERAYLEFRRFGPGADLQLIVASNKMKARRTIEPFRYRFHDEDEWQTTGDRLTLTLSDGFSGVIFIPSIVQPTEQIEDSLEYLTYFRSNDFKAVEQEQAATINKITLRGAFRHDLTLRLGSLRAPIAALQTCADDLTTQWGIDVEAHKTLSRPAIPVNLSEVPSMMSYPPKMLQQAMPGLVNVRLDIDETGRITACHIQMPLSDPAFEESSCADIQHALDFAPALDKDGKPIASFWITKVHFSLAH